MEVDTDMQQVLHGHRDCQMLADEMERQNLSFTDFFACGATMCSLSNRDDFLMIHSISPTTSPGACTLARRARYLVQELAANVPCLDTPTRWVRVHTKEPWFGKVPNTAALHTFGGE